jgi:hypothetical protein
MPKEWSEEDEIDPVKIQKEFLDMAKESLSELKKIDAAKKAREESEIAAFKSAAGKLGDCPASLRMPTTQEVLARCVEHWAIIEKAMPTAPTEIRVDVFRLLQYTEAVESAKGSIANGSIVI